MNNTDTKLSEIRSVPNTPPEPESITISLTETEAEVIANYIFSKYTRLEDIGLHDSKCCIAMCSVWHKIKRAEKEKTKTFSLSK